MKILKNESNVLLITKNIKVIIDLFLGPFLTSYFLKTSMEAITKL